MDTRTSFPAPELIHNATENYNDTVAAKNWTKIDPKYEKSIALTTHMSNSDKEKTFVLGTVQGRGGYRTHTHTNTKGRDPNKSYVEVIANLESWRIKKLNGKITRDGQD